MTVPEPTVPSTALVAAGQLGPADATRAGTVKRIVSLIQQAGDAGVALLVLPELALSPYFAAEVHEDITVFVEPGFPSEETQAIVAAVRDTGVVTVLPHAESQDGLVYNSSVVLGADGEVTGRYRKSHIPGKVSPDRPGEFAILEKRYFAPGNLGFPLHASPAGPFGIGICYDRRFPELYRCYALQGASAVACCFNTPVMTDRGETLESTQEAQELAVRGGAISNAVAVIAAGKAGMEGGVRYSAGSSVIDHKGRILAKARTEGDELVTAELDLKAAAEARERMDLAGNRRPELYGLLTAVRAPTRLVTQLGAIAMARVWDKFLTERDKRHLAVSGWGSRPPKGLGAKPAVIVVDDYYAALGTVREPILESVKTWPASCGLEGWDAIDRTVELLDAARQAGVPIAYVHGVMEPAGPWNPQAGNSMFAMSHEQQAIAYQIVKEVEPQPGDLVLPKTAASAFAGTPLAYHLSRLGIDTLIVVGETTSGCVRATVLDGAAYRYKIGVVEECCFDRTESAHAINLFDMHHKYADVISLSSAISYLLTGSTEVAGAPAAAAAG